MNIEPIGTIYTPFEDLEGMPIQPTGAQGVEGRIELLEQYVEGLKDIDGFSHLILLFALHKSEGYKLTVKPFLDTTPRGLFATRAPRRPNPIGLSIVELERVEGNTLYIKNVDILNGTPLLDIKPYVSKFDQPENVRNGWIEKSGARVKSHKSDDRFTEKDNL